MTFAKGEEIKYISHLDLIRAWERLLRRAGAPLAYSKGFNPHPKFSVAAPLAVGLTGEAELMDIILEGDLSPEQFREMIEPQMPVGLRIVQVVEVPLDEPSLQSRLRFVEYVVDLATDLSVQEVETRVLDFMAAEKVQRQRRRRANGAAPESQSDKRRQVQSYDLRALVESIYVEPRTETDNISSNAHLPEKMRLHLRLRAGPDSIGRPDEVLDALDLAEYSEHICRARLIIGSST